MSQANHTSVSIKATDALPFSTMRGKVDQSQMNPSNTEGFECIQNKGTGDKPNSNGDFDRAQYVHSFPREYLPSGALLSLVTFCC